MSGSVTIDNATGPVSLGGPTGSPCAADQVSGGVKVEGLPLPVTVDRAVIGGSLNLTVDSGQVSASGDKVTGSVLAQGVSGPLVMSGDTTSKGLTVTLDTGAVTITSNVVGGALAVSRYTGPPAPVVGANTVTGKLSCVLDTPAPVDGGQLNTAHTATGQCAALA